MADFTNASLPLGPLAATDEPSAPVSPAGTWLSFAGITAMGLLLVFALQHLLIDDELYFNSLGERYTVEHIEQLLAQSHRWSWLTYALLPVSNLIRFGCLASCLALGHFLKAGRWSFRTCFWVVMQAELLLLLPLLLKIGWFTFVQPHYTLDDLQFFYPLSLLSLVDFNTVDPWLRYPLQLVSVFEVAYWVALVYGLRRALGYAGGGAWRLVAVSYGSAMLLWVLLVMFLVVSNP